MKCEICGKEILRDSQCINYKYYHNDCIENLQQEIKHLDEVNCKLRRKIGQLEYNWNKLKEYLHNVDVVVDYSENYDGHFIDYDELVNKMQELEQGSDSNGNN